MGLLSHSYTSFFKDVRYISPDAIFELTKLYNADPFKGKVNLGQGTYKDNEGKPWILPCVLAAKERLKNVNHEYLPILGLPQMRELAAKLVLGSTANAVVEKRVASCQALSGTGALHLAGLFLRRCFDPKTPIYITEPTWSNHRAVFESVGFSVTSYQYYNEDTGSFAYEEVLNTLRDAPVGSIFVLHSCAHNPSGCDPSEQQWKEIAAIMKSRSMFPLFDSAYLGMTSGDYDRDAFAIRYFIEDMQMEAAICLSFAKSMGLYSERIGALVLITDSAASAAASESVFEQLQRAEVSNPPAFGARIASTILGDAELKEEWGRNLVSMSSRIASMRQALLDELRRLETPRDFQRIVDQRGMFCILGLSKDQVLHLRHRYHIYMADNSRISIAGLNESNVAYVASSIKETVCRVKDDSESNCERER